MLCDGMQVLACSGLHAALHALPPSTLSAAQGMTSATEQLSICSSMIEMLEARNALGLSHKLPCAATGSEHAHEGRHLATFMHFHRQADSCPSNRLQSPQIEQ